MNKRRFSFDVGAGSRAWLPAFTVLAVSFILGAAAGCALSSGFSGGGEAREFLTAYVTSIEADIGLSGVASLFWEAGVYHVAAFLLGFTVFGTAGIPVVSAVRGFTLTFAMATLVRVYSLDGALAGLLLLGLTALFSVPIFFMLAVEAMSCSARLAGVALLGVPPAGPGIYSKAYFVRFLTAILLLILICVGERALLLAVLPRLMIF